MIEAKEEYWVIIPAAGTGQRFLSEIPKQYLRIHQKTILEHTLSVFLSQSWIKRIIIAVNKNDTYFSTLPIENPKILKVIGGEIRTQSVFNALNAIKNNAKDSDWVLVHDAVRPCLHEYDLLNLKQTLDQENIGGILASPVLDTMKSAENNIIQRTVSRENLWHALTPQMYRFKVLLDAYTDCLQSGISVTDDAAVIENYGLHSKIVPSLHPNPKLTYTRDLAYIEGLLACE